MKYECGTLGCPKLGIQYDVPPETPTGMPEFGTPLCSYCGAGTDMVVDPELLSLEARDADLNRQRRMDSIVELVVTDSAVMDHFSEIIETICNRMDEADGLMDPIAECVLLTLLGKM